MSLWDALEDRPEWQGQDDERRGFDGEDQELDVEVMAETEKAILCRIEGHSKRWVPKSQIAEGATAPAKGMKGKLIVTGWFYEKLEEDDGEVEENDVEIEGCACLSEARSGKAIRVRLPNGREEWIPTSQIREASEVKGDGDGGKLVVSAWIAEEKKLEAGG